MSYTITIEQTTTETKKTGGDWEKVDQVQKKEEFSEETYLSDVYGYTPFIEKDVTETKQVLKYTVETLDLVSVLDAINKGEIY